MRPKPAPDLLAALRALLDGFHARGSNPTLLAFTAAALKAGIAVRDSSDAYRQVIGCGRYALRTDAYGFERLIPKPTCETAEKP